MWKRSRASVYDRFLLPWDLSLKFFRYWNGQLSHSIFAVVGSCSYGVHSIPHTSRRCPATASPVSNRPSWCQALRCSQYGNSLIPKNFKETLSRKLLELRWRSFTSPVLSSSFRTVNQSVVYHVHLDFLGCSCAGCCWKRHSRLVFRSPSVICRSLCDFTSQ